MIDVSEFLAERERLRRFCFIRTRAVVVLRDAVAARLDTFRDLDTFRFREPGDQDAVSRLAEFIQLLLMVDAKRFADPDDVCADFGPSLIAYPTPDERRDVDTVLTASDNSFEAIMIDYRPIEAVLPLMSPGRPVDLPRAVRTWDRALRKQRRVAAILTLNRHDDAVMCDGGRLLRRGNSDTFDLAGPFWRRVYDEIGRQPCMRREAWRRSDFQGTA